MPVPGEGESLKRLRSRTQAYQKVFMGDRGEITPFAKQVLADLAKFCRFLEPTLIVAKDGHVDIHATMHAEGRREVFLRIQAYLKVNLPELTKALQEVENGGLTVKRPDDAATE